MQTTIDNLTVAAQLRALADKFEAFEADDSKPPKLGIGRKAKLSIDALIGGAVLTPGQLGMIQDMYDSKVASELSGWRRSVYDQLTAELADCLNNARAAKPLAHNGPAGFMYEQMIRAGIPQDTINAVSRAAQQYGRDLRGEVDPPIEPEPERKPIVARCMSCRQPFTVPPRKGSVCPRCGAFQF